MTVAPVLPANFGIPAINACIDHANAAAGEINKLEAYLATPTCTSEGIRDNYAKVNEHIERVIALKEVAYAVCDNMPHKNQTSARKELDLIFDPFTTGQTRHTTLKVKHETLLKCIAAKIHEGKIQFPIPSPPNCGCSRCRSLLPSTGWVVTGLAASFALMTLTPLGEQIGPILAQTPKFFGENCRDIGEYFTNVFSSKSVCDMARSSTTNSLGKIALIPAVSYPLYRSLKNPIIKCGTFVFGKIDDNLTSMSKNPLTTVIASSGFYYFVISQLTVGKLFGVDRERAILFIPLAAAFGTAVFADYARRILDDYKKHALQNPSPAAVPKLPPPPVNADYARRILDDYKKHALQNPSPAAVPKLPPPPANIVTASVSNNSASDPKKSDPPIGAALTATPDMQSAPGLQARADAPVKQTPVVPAPPIAVPGQAAPQENRRNQLFNKLRSLFYT